MPRFFVPSENIENSTVTITGDDAFHIARSLRMAAGDIITVCDMHANEHSCRLLRIRDDKCECEILETHCGKTESPLEITLYMSYPKGDKLETVIQKAVELGAVRIVPFESSRCIKKPKAEKEEKQTARLLKIAEEAAKQCGRAVLPTVSTPVSFSVMLNEAAKADIPLFCYEGDGTISLKEALENAKKDAKTAAVVVGCEGGFSQKEAEEAKELGLLAVGLGPRILRCETAPVYALSAISFHFEL